ncbi:DUF2075 domain-containing protein [Candidatus Saccharibacteria bacterium]|nr:DUF2075 domain-containing protein [Candidatus Saccharibacteria bacterium]
MIVYQDTKKQFQADVDLNQIVDKINNEYIPRFGHTTESQLRAWKNSMQYMHNVLNTGEIPDDAGVAIEYNIQPTSKRIDFLLSGKDENGNLTAIIVELKQWESCEAVRDEDGVVETFVGGGNRKVAHPSYQAMSYKHLIQDYNEAAQEGPVYLFPCAFLHNYRITPEDPIVDPQYDEYLKEAPVFGANDFEKLRNFIKNHLSTGDKGETIFKIEYGRIRPSKMLQDSIVRMLQGKKEFVLIDTQKIVYEHAKRIARKAEFDNKKHVLIVKGGPGTGKTVLAINLLSDFLNESLSAFYVTKNQAPRAVFKQKLKDGGFKNVFIDTLFQSSGSFIDSVTNGIDVLLVDESHRLNEKSGMFSNKGENQTKEIINAAKFSIFFIDEAQRVTLKDKGTIADIKKFASEQNAEIEEIELDSQFRCNGSDGYLAWLDNLLEIRETANANSLEYDYDFRVFDDPNELYDAIVKRNDNNKARMVAGYCWDWVKAGQNNTDVLDITIPEFGFAKSWNLGNTSTWAIDPESIEQIGCIHTCQGLEFDYVGVIIGDDMRYENGRIVTDATKRAKTDSSLKGLKKLIAEDPDAAEEIADKIIKNTYRTLMTRGMKGCYVYCTDTSLAEYLKASLARLNK